MSIEEDEAEAEDWGYAQYLQNSLQAISEFTAERLMSYYVDNPRVALPARAFVNEAEQLITVSPTAAYLLAAVSIEVAIKDVYLRPIIYGLVHSEAAAGLIAEMALRVTRFELLKSPFLQLLREHGDIDFAAYRRGGSDELLWTEIVRIQKKRNQIMHRAERAGNADASTATAVARNLIDLQLPLLANSLGLHTHADYSLCNSPFCEHPLDDGGSYA
jgi:hypothetical protein